jgi:hypothetical protein
MSDTSNAPSNPPAKEEEDKRKRGAAIWWWGGAALVAAIIAGLYFGHFLGGGKVRVQKRAERLPVPVDGVDSQGRSQLRFPIQPGIHLRREHQRGRARRRGALRTETVRQVIVHTRNAAERGN